MPQDPLPKRLLAGKHEDLVRVLRIIEIIGDRRWVESTLARSITGRRDYTERNSITVVTLTQYPEILHEVPPEKKPPPLNLKG